MDEKCGCSGECNGSCKKDPNILKNRIFSDICQDCDCHAAKPYCTLVEFFLHLLSQEGDRERTMVQIKCVEKYKYELGVNNNKEYVWNDAFMEWVKNGFSKRFAEVYDPKLKLAEIYRKTIKGE